MKSQRTGRFSYPAVRCAGNSSTLFGVK